MMSKDYFEIYMKDIFRKPLSVRRIEFKKYDKLLKKAGLLSIKKQR